MRPTQLRALLDEGSLWRDGGGLAGVARQAWIVEGEDRLSYTTIVRLVECCREHHWEVDIAPHVAAAAEAAEATSLDSITKSLSCEFLHPVAVNSDFSITYRITEVRTHSYRLTFELRDWAPDRVCARIDMVCVFYDPVQQHAILAPPAVAAALRSRAAHDA